MRSRWLEMSVVAFVAVVAFGVFGPSPGPHLEHLSKAAERVGAEVWPAAASSPVGDLPLAGTLNDFSHRVDVQDIANILMFVPFGLLFPARWPRWRWWTVPAGVLLSAAIELTQLIFLSWRSPRLADVGWNALGAALGFAIWLAGRASSRAAAALSGRADADADARKGGDHVLTGRSDG